ncbi:unnamed protein product [Anisakis simplex]|uniref:Uncharacterized protein n=1 Tax=Anisakis simplex TaxID=6269 RepID=A0A0M3JD65_ANISI|nr:unnamed protein product [Anisakis simplex]
MFVQTANEDHSNAEPVSLEAARTQESVEQKSPATMPKAKCNDVIDLQDDEDLSDEDRKLGIMKGQKINTIIGLCNRGSSAELMVILK